MWFPWPPTHSPRKKLGPKGIKKEEEEKPALIQKPRRLRKRISRPEVKGKEEITCEMGTTTLTSNANEKGFTKAK